MEMLLQRDCDVDLLFFSEVWVSVPWFWVFDSMVLNMMHLSPTVPAHGITACRKCTD